MFTCEERSVKRFSGGGGVAFVTISFFLCRKQARKVLRINSWIEALVSITGFMSAHLALQLVL